MENSNNNIEQVFQSGFKDFEHKVSDKVWQNLDAELFDNVSGIQDKGEGTIIKSMFIASIPFALMIGATFMIPSEPDSNQSNAQLVSINNKIEKVEDSNSEEVQSEVNDDESEGIFNNNRDEFIIVEDEMNDEVEEPISENKIINAAVQKEDYQPKEMPSLSDNAYIQYDYYKRKDNIVYSNFSINKLKKGVLLVRLKTRQRGIDALLKMGQKKKAEKLKKEVMEDNLKVMEAFADKYSFSDVYFFFSSESEKVKNRQFDGYFLNENLEIDESIVLDPSQKFYMILDIGALKIPQNKEGEVINTALSRALVVKDRDFEQLYRPFPFYVDASNEQMISLQVNKLNNKFNSYYKSNRAKF